jgi:Cu+-exporting ATPase
MNRDTPGPDPACSWSVSRHGTSKEDMMEKDPVCGMQVDPAKAAGTSERNGKTYYFCSPRCKQKFDADPKQYGA